MPVLKIAQKVVTLLLLDILSPNPSWKFALQLNSELGNIFGRVAGPLRPTIICDRARNQCDPIGQFIYCFW